MALDAATLQTQLDAVNSAITTALANPAPSWSVGQVKFDQSAYLEMLCEQRDKLITQLRSFPCESIDTVQNQVGTLGNDATEFFDEFL